LIFPEDLQGNPLAIFPEDLQCGSFPNPAADFSECWQVANQGANKTATTALNQLESE
jgi:hypothetical protein